MEHCCRALARSPFKYYTGQFVGVDDRFYCGWGLPVAVKHGDQTYRDVMSIRYCPFCRKDLQHLKGARRQRRPKLAKVNIRYICVDCGLKQNQKWQRSQPIMTYSMGTCDRCRAENVAIFEASEFATST